MANENFLTAIFSKLTITGTNVPVVQIPIDNNNDMNIIHKHKVYNLLGVVT